MKALAVAGFLALAACGRGNDGTELIDATTIDAPTIQCGELTCSGSAYCDFEYNTCGTSGEKLRCQSPATCGSSNPVCGCDGVIHDSECAAYAAGTDLDGSFSCPKTADHFVCGYAECSLSNEVCSFVWKGSGTYANSRFGCIAFPTQCAATPTCDCVNVNTGGWSGCMGDASTGFTVYYAPAIR